MSAEKDVISKINNQRQAAGIIYLDLNMYYTLRKDETEKKKIIINLPERKLKECNVRSNRMMIMRQ